MQIEEIRDYCLNKQHVTETLPFGPDTLVFKVGGKIFLIIGLDQIETICFNVKCEPEYASELRETYAETVFPGFHMNKKHWNTVYCYRQVSSIMIKQLIDHSYQLVYSSLPKRFKK